MPPAAEAFIFQANGRLIATNKMVDIEERLPLVSSLKLTNEQRALIARAPELKVSNQNDWGPVWITRLVADQMVSRLILFKMISEMTGLKV